MIRAYDPTRDREAVHRIWQETGWSEKDKQESMIRYVESGRALVAEMNGEAECLVLSCPATLRYLTTDIPQAAITGVTTSRVGRKQGWASRLTAKLIAEDVQAGAMMSTLSCFEQGYYNQLGFGTGSYEHYLSFDPATINVSTRPRVPRRLKSEDWEIMHTARLARLKRHGACDLLHSEMTRCEVEPPKNWFGLGYFDGYEGTLSHFFGASANNVEDGPYRINLLVYQTNDQFLELMALIKTLGDQVHLVKMTEPPGVQLQDMLIQPFKHRRQTQKSDLAAESRASASWQGRICDLPGCMARTHLPTGDLRFNLSLSDPIARYLDNGEPWRGIGGTYVVSLGKDSSAESGMDASLPTLTASVGAFTRLWLGTNSATGLTFTDEISGPQELLEALDWTLRVPTPHSDWDY